MFFQMSQVLMYNDHSLFIGIQNTQQEEYIIFHTWANIIREALIRSLVSIYIYVSFGYGNWALYRLISRDQFHYN